MDGLNIAIQMCGNQAALARRLGIARQTITSWKKRGVPLSAAAKIEAKLGVSMRVICPQHFQN